MRMIAEDVVFMPSCSFSFHSQSSLASFPIFPAGYACGWAALREILEGKESCQDAVSVVCSVFFCLLSHDVPCPFSAPCERAPQRVFRECCQNVPALATEILRAQTSCDCLGQNARMPAAHQEFGYSSPSISASFPFSFLPAHAHVFPPWPESPRWLRVLVTFVRQATPRSLPPSCSQTAPNVHKIQAM